MYKEYVWGKNAAPSTSYDYKGLFHCLNKKKNHYILDYGCGNGAISLKLIKRGYDVYGVDASKSGIQIANSHISGRNRFFEMDFEKDDFPDEIKDVPFDTIISTQVIEHLYSPKSYVQQCNRILPVGGVLLMTTPYHGYLKNLVMAITGRMDAHFTVLWECGHIKFFSKKTLTKLLEENGFMVTGFKGMERVPYLWKSMLIVAEKQEEIF